MNTTHNDTSVHSIPWAQRMTKEGHHLWAAVIWAQKAKGGQKAHQKWVFPFLLASAQEHHLPLLDLMAAAVPVHVLLPFAAE